MPGVRAQLLNRYCLACPKRLKTRQGIAFPEPRTGSPQTTCRVTTR